MLVTNHANCIFFPTATEVEAPCQPNNSECSRGGTKQPTEEPTEEPSAEPSAEVPTVVECTCPRCDVRSTCTSNTFRRNGYTYGEEISIVSLSRDSTGT